ncbi:MAG: hypothetical protein F4Y27_04325 [Acidimicrobiaceae bacterium]|nr:hypothetical protein [Acidimicrobiaceae bacterium]MYA73882.1 hypothetical protein [Acidimicrobiaceae bacterium]MYD05966.1 hypothetical protein [Acidimicrobiaceae bacterium]MYG54907.1 hypothetical protein [Acidimicrobiaceae bacterium]MYI58631.1 hypothetical protein [Acidimicrobiaceae bacterium]
MSELLSATKTLSEAWFQALAHTVDQPRGRCVHLAMTVENPGLEDDAVRAALDRALAEEGEPGVATVAGTIFPTALYQSPGFSWSPDLEEQAARALDTAASNLYGRYLSMLPKLLKFPGNRSGTYFARMISWPGKKAGGTNQLDLRISRIRSEFARGNRTNNTLDIDIAADALLPESLAGVQIYAPTDRRMRGFPCLVHIDLTLFDGTLHCLAVYRHQYLITKAYGNLVGLSRLMHFLCEQTGAECGELVLHATMADAEPGHPAKPRNLVQAIEALV